MTNKLQTIREALVEIATTRFQHYDGNKPFVSDHDSGYSMGVADGHRLAARWANEALIVLNKLEKEQEWQDIGTAPHEVTIILGWFDYDKVWQQAIRPYVYSNRRHANATHWKPIPKPPKPSTAPVDAQNGGVNLEELAVETANKIDTGIRLIRQKAVSDPLQMMTEIILSALKKAVGHE